MSLLQINSLTKSYSTRGGVETIALQDLNLTVEMGEFLGVMGPSGSGKTTLLNILGTLDTQTSGTIKLKDQDIATLPRKEIAAFRKKHLGFIFQDFNLLDNLTVGENIILPLLLLDTNCNEVQAELGRIAEILNLVPVLDKYPFEVSGGQKQRAAAARAVIKKPSLVLADEPTGNLDSQAAKDLMECLVRLNETLGATILMATHDPAMASYCRRIIFIKDGRLFDELISSGDTKETFDRVVDISRSIRGAR